MAHELADRRIAFMIASEGVEQVELTEPWQAVKDDGGTPELLAPKAGKAQAGKPAAVICKQLVAEFRG